MIWNFGEGRKNIMQNIIDDIQLPKELLEKRGVDLTGEDIYQIVIAAINSSQNQVNQSPRATKLIRGLKDMAEFLHCSVPTISRMVRRGDIYGDAVIKIERTILFDAELALQQLREMDDKWQKFK